MRKASARAPPELLLARPAAPPEEAPEPLSQLSRTASTASTLSRGGAGPPSQLSRTGSTASTPGRGASPPSQLSRTGSTTSTAGRGTGSVLGGGMMGASGRKHEAHKTKKAVERNAQAIQNRIRFFQREEEKIWRDLEEVQRQAAAIEGGRSRNLEKKIADRTIQQERDAIFLQNQAKAAVTKNVDNKHHSQQAVTRDKQLAGQEQRRASQELLRRKRMAEMEARLENAERANAIQRSQLEAKLKGHEEREARLLRLRQEQEAEWQAAENDVFEAESKLPELERQEIACLQQLQNSRIVSQSVFQELQAYIGSNNPAATLLHARQKGHEYFDTPPSTGYIGEEMIEVALDELPPEESFADIAVQQSSALLAKLAAAERIGAEQDLV